MCQVPRCFLSNSLAQLEMAWYMNPKGRTGQLFPTQIDLYFSLFVWSGWFIRLKTFKTQKKVQVVQNANKLQTISVPRLTTVGIAETIPTNDLRLFNDCKLYAALVFLRKALQNIIIN